ncbi:MAG: glycosyltransferase [Chitinophagaceae bacterium]|nr:glycosyltransferase [Chitinophagaceae bacterium]
MPYLNKMAEMLELDFSRQTVDGEHHFHGAVASSLLPRILLISSYPPRECGIASFSSDLVRSIHEVYGGSVQIEVCSVTRRSNEAWSSAYQLSQEDAAGWGRLAAIVSEGAPAWSAILLEHEFGLYEGSEAPMLTFLATASVPVVICFHTVLPAPSASRLAEVKSLAAHASTIIVMTRWAATQLAEVYHVPPSKIQVIAHGTHAAPPADRRLLKAKAGFGGSYLLVSFGLLSRGKSIETSIRALPLLLAEIPDAHLLIIGKTHPCVVADEGEAYRVSLQALAEELHLHSHVHFIDQFLQLPQLMEYLNMADVYIFSSSDPHQAVSGTFAYAMAAGCPIVSTPIPPALEVADVLGLSLFGFGDSAALAQAVVHLYQHPAVTATMREKSIRLTAGSSWHNAAIAHMGIFNKLSPAGMPLQFSLPPIDLQHLVRMTTGQGLLQFAQLATPLPDSGYTLDDNARALMVACQYYELTHDPQALDLVYLYFGFLGYCLQPYGNFLNYVNDDGSFGEQNDWENLDDANGRAIWALGHLLQLGQLLPQQLQSEALAMLTLTLTNIGRLHSPRAMAFCIKGLCLCYPQAGTPAMSTLVVRLADRLLEQYRQVAEAPWLWFENSLTYANAVLPEALLMAGQLTGQSSYIQVATESFDYLLTRIFAGHQLQVIRNDGWMHRSNRQVAQPAGAEQPIDVAYTVLALASFQQALGPTRYAAKMQAAFSWFLGNNRLGCTMYNRATGGCYDGLELHDVNMNQGAESLVCYLMARLTMAEQLLNEWKTQQNGFDDDE